MNIILRLDHLLGSCIKIIKDYLGLFSSHQFHLQIFLSHFGLKGRVERLQMAGQIQKNSVVQIAGINGAPVIGAQFCEPLGSRNRRPDWGLGV